MNSSRILVIGDSGVGKTRFSHILSRTPISKPIDWTIGCNTFVFSHMFRNKEYFIELLDIGGSSVYTLARKLFYKPVDGIILVHDLSNKKSFSNLSSWITEVIGSNKYSLNDNNICLNNQKIPFIYVANKSDLHDITQYKNHITISSLDNTSLTGSTLEGDKMNNFLNQVILNQYYSPGSNKGNLSMRSYLTNTSDSPV